jgi:muramoyltetrapeptide carboxypeptidase
MFADPEIKGVIASGGYGASQILNGIDYDLIKHNPKIFIGFSDVTGLHLAIHKMTGLVTFHGPTAFSTFNEYTAGHFRRALFSTEPLGELKNPDEADKITLEYPVRTVTRGKASGRLIGGNLSLIAALMGTPYEIETDNCILFIEDVGEDSYRVDRMLTQLMLAGKLDKVKGVIWGSCRKCNDNLETGVFTLGEVIDNILIPLNVPVISGMMIGHTSNKLTLPLGVKATLDADNQTLTITESALI